MTGMETKRARGKCIANALVCQLCWTFLCLMVCIMELLQVSLGPQKWTFWVLLDFSTGWPRSCHPASSIKTVDVIGYIYIHVYLLHNYYSVVSVLCYYYMSCGDCDPEVLNVIAAMAHRDACFCMCFVFFHVFCVFCFGCSSVARYHWFCATVSTVEKYRGTR